MSNIIDEIRNGEHDAIILQVRDAAFERSKQVAIQEAYEWNRGDIVVFNSRANPHYLIGLKARVNHVNRTTANIDLLPNQSAGRFTNGKGIKCPLTYITKAPQATAQKAG